MSKRDPKKQAAREGAGDRQSKRRPRKDELSTDDLVGESEYSVRVSGGGGRDQDEAEGGPPVEKLSAKPEDLGRRYLEEVTEAPGADEEDDEEYQAERR